ncbi:peptidoglycan-binding domain-containing protein [Pararhodobacter sp.]|uniref:peptidoglycan-binding domain-containing protein n=1 Tax=Pararhodobacter sp. TaxID=2127056 RepID=UPI002FDFB05C
MLARLILFLILLAAAPAAAWTDDVRCVQQQLAQAGQDAGPADGIVGPRTLAALREHAARAGVAGGHDLTPDTATTWCRRLGEADPALRAFWPSGDNAVVVQTGPGVDPVLARLIRVRLPELHHEVAALLGVELSGTDRVFVGAGVDELRAMITRDTRHRPIGNLDAVLEDHCNPNGRIGAFATPGVMVICLRPDTRLLTDLAYSTLVFVLTHEATHLVQFQLTGLPESGTAPEGRVRFEGPMWLLEGLADVVGHALGDRLEPLEIRELGARRYAGRAVPRLTQLQTRGDLLSRRDDVYQVGMWAASLLIERAGFSGAGRLFALMGEGQPFPEAFAEVYGRSLDSFYETFAAEAQPQQPRRPAKG